MAIHATNYLDQWKLNLSQYQRDPESYYLTQDLELKEGKGQGLPDAEKVFSSWRKKKVFVFQDHQEKEKFHEICSQLSHIYCENPTATKIFQWVCKSLPIIHSKVRYLESLQKTMTMFCIVKESYLNYARKSLLMAKGLEIGRELKNRNIIIAHEEEMGMAMLFPEASSSKELAFLIAFIQEIKKTNSAADHKGSLFLATKKDLSNCRSFLLKHCKSNDPSISEMAKVILLQYDLDETIGKIKEMAPHFESSRRDFSSMTEWATDIGEYFPNCTEVLNELAHFYFIQGEHEIVQRYNSATTLYFISIQQKLSEVEQILKQHESLYSFFSLEMGRMLISKNSDSYRNFYCGNARLFTSQEFLNKQPEHLDLSFSYERGDVSSLSLPDKSDFLPDHLKKPVKSKKRKQKEQISKSKKSTPKKKIDALSLPTEEVQIKTIEVSWREQIGLTKAIPLIQYATHVTRWFENLDAVLETEEYVSQGESVRKWARYAHTFPFIVDQFVETPYCHQGIYENPRTESKDILYSIPAEVTTPQGTKRVLFQYAVDRKTKICYHRCIHRIPNEDFIQSFLDEKVWNRIDYPTIAESVELENRASMKLEENGVLLSYEPTFGSVAFEEGPFKITLFRLEF
ncbi:hypothetical protein [Simkania negevensis]|uniref:Uncharacterized protein n=1 Tax=Simkania negevensis (strain ATCC VR-1471 / DSM 27360 / Z) TaxID=331113 RepID=F8L7Y8_SIMNZ|nr:hypothetical protein [Simkania negevensis]CCB88890.1 hypothetical protein SNE_A10130 [Simkania negevensis Z]